MTLGVDEGEAIETLSLGHRRGHLLLLRVWRQPRLLARKLGLEVPNVCLTRDIWFERRRELTRVEGDPIDRGKPRVCLDVVESEALRGVALCVAKRVKLR